MTRLGWWFALPVLGLACAHAPAAAPPPAATPPAPAPPAPLVEHVVRPETIDPEADKWLQDELAVLDPAAPRANRLVVYLVGANNKPVGGRPMLRELAAMGFHVVAPMYANDYDIRAICSPPKESG